MKIRLVSFKRISMRIRTQNKQFYSERFSFPHDLIFQGGKP